MSSTAVKSLLRYLYTGKLSSFNSVEDCQRLLELADYFGFTESEEQKAVHQHLLHHCMNIVAQAQTDSGIKDTSTITVDKEDLEESN